MKFEDEYNRDMDVKSPTTPTKEDESSPSTCSHSSAPVERHQNIAEQIKDKISHFIGHYHQAPSFTIDSAYILTGYRINFHTPKQVIKSLFMKHNELVNVWSHLLGSVIMIIMIIMLGFSVASNFNSNRMNSAPEGKLNEFFSPLYDKIANFTELEHTWRAQIETTKQDMSRFRADALDGFEENALKMIGEFENIKHECTPENVMKFLGGLEEKIGSLSVLYKDVQSSLGDFQINNLVELSSLGEKLKRNLREFQERLSKHITTPQYDWIDIYTYFDRVRIQDVQLRASADNLKLSRWPILIFLLSAIFCLMGSSIFHLFYCIGIKANSVLIRLDYAGICILIFGSCFPPMVYGFYCEPYYYNLYLTIIGITSGVVFTVSMMDFIHTEKYRKLKSLMYGGLGIFAGIPVIHLVFNSASASTSNDYLPFMDSVPFYLGMGMSYLGGLCIFTARCPERYKPGHYDICGHSHQLWHFCVVMAVILHYLGSFENYYTRIGIPCLISE